MTTEQTGTLFVSARRVRFRHRRPVDGGPVVAGLAGFLAVHVVGGLLALGVPAPVTAVLGVMFG